MSQLPEFEATLEANLTTQQRKEVFNKLKNLKGVLYASFNAAKDSVEVVYYFGAGTVATAKKIAGVKKVVPHIQM
jgi:hypothetical protein